jgi:hypothetical protein
MSELSRAVIDKVAIVLPPILRRNHLVRVHRMVGTSEVSGNKGVIQLVHVSPLFRGKNGGYILTEKRSPPGNLRQDLTALKFQREKKENERFPTEIA